MAKYAGRVADGLICTSGKGMDLYTDKLLPAAIDGLAHQPAPRRRHQPDDRDQALLRPHP